MKKNHLIILVMILLGFTLVGCNNRKDKAEGSTESTITEELTNTQEIKEEIDIIAQGGGKDETYLSTASDADATYSSEEELPETLPPLDNNDAINPTFKSLNNMDAEHFNRDAILDAVLSYMYKEEISNDVCTSINIDASNCLNNTIAYKLTLSFEKNDDRVVTLFGTSSNHYDIQTYIEADEDELVPDD